MGYRMTWLAGAAGIGLAIARLERLLQGTIEGPPWEVVLLAAAVLGAAVTWAMRSYRMPGWAVLLGNGIALALTVVRISVPQTTWFIFPTASSWTALQTEIVYARDVIRTGVAPVLPLVGVIALLLIVFWSLGALLSWGLLERRPYLAVLPPFAFYLQLATMDRQPAGGWTIAMLILLGLALVTIAYESRRSDTGLLVTRRTRIASVRAMPSVAFAALVITLLASVFATAALADRVPRFGVLSWRHHSGLTGDFYGGVSYNPFVGIQQGLVSPSNIPLFVAEVDGDEDTSRLYFRLLTLDTFSGDTWFADRPLMRRPENIDRYEDPDEAFRGPTSTVEQRITILALQQEWLPAVYAPIDMSADVDAIERGFRVKPDGALRFGSLSYRGMTYSVTSEVPIPDYDVLARTDDGELSLVFASAVDEGDWEPDEAPTEMPEPVALPDVERYLELPTDLPAGIPVLARQQVRGLTTDYERALALESFFRTPGNFIYSTDIQPGHSAQNIGDWLLTPNSPNYRIGYCEQFATAMAVMARTLEIPSRVVLGFTPGERLDDGRVVIRDRNAHAWVELWMPTQGWVRFDPTPRSDRVNPSELQGLPFDVRPYLDVEIPAPELPTSPPQIILPFEDFQIPDAPFIGGGGSDDATGPAFTIPSWVWRGLLGGFVVFGLLPMVKAIRRRLRIRRAEQGDISAAWQEIVDRLADLGDRPAHDSTPVEVSRATDGALRPLAEVYGRSIYGPPGSIDTGHVVTAVGSLRETEERLSMRYSTPRRMLSRYSPASLIPRRFFRRRR